MKELKSKISSFLHNERVQKVTAIFICILMMFIGTGWGFVYDMFTNNSDWTKTDNVLYYSWCMFWVVVFGAICHAIFLFFAFLIIIAFLGACYYGWFVMLPLFLMFIVICIGRWFYLKKHII